MESGNEMLQAFIKKNLWYFNLEVELEIKNDQVLILLGPSGSGKTTILECLAGLCKPNEGIIKLDDRLLFSNQDGINVPARDRQIGYLFQEYALFPHLTVKQNVLYGLRNKKQNELENKYDYELLLQSFGISHLIDRFPGQLSGGEKQRVALVRALVLQPSLLLLDEPFSSLDIETKVKLRHEIKEMHQSWNIPLIIVTHDEEDANLLGHVVISLNQGQINHKDLSTRKC